MRFSIKQKVCLLALLFWLPVSVAAGGSPQEQMTPESRLSFSLPVPSSAAHQKYLGVSGDRVTPAQIAADIVIVEIFSMYCPYCQKEAPSVNRLYELLPGEEKKGRVIKLVGIGAGNSDFEVDVFKKKYAIPFPLFSDARFTLHRQIGEVGTPYFFGLEMTGKGGFRVFYSAAGKISDPRLFLENLLKKAEGE